MSRCSGVSWWLVFVAGLSGSAAPVRADEEQPIARAREIWQLMVSEQFDEFVATGDQTMKAALGAEQAAQIWGGLEFQLGGYQTIESTASTKHGDYDSVRLVCRFDRGTATMRLVLDHEGRMSGLWLDQVAPNPPYEAPTYVDRAAFREEPLVIRCGAFELPGVLSLPKDGARHAGIVLVHGSGPHDEDETAGASKPFRDLAWGLASHGVAVLRYEKRTHKYREGIKAEDVTLEWETIDDALAAVDCLRERPEIDARRVFVLGHSLGGMAAPFIAQRDGNLGGIILMAGNARSILSLIEDQVEYLARLDGELSDDERKSLAEVKQATAAIRAGRLDDVEKPLLGAPAKYWADLHRRDPVAAAARLKCPILILHGGRDYQVSRADYELWQQRLGEREGVTIRLYENLNHLMISGEGPSGPAEYQKVGHVDERVITDIVKWIGVG
jgi:dienelactone hydrolase